MTAWSALGLRAADADTGGALDYLVAHEAELDSRPSRARGARRGGARPRPAVAARAASREAGRGQRGRSGRSSRCARAAVPLPQRSSRTCAARRRGTAAFPWPRGIAPDSNDTAAAVQALRAAGVAGKPIARALAYLRGSRPRRRLSPRRPAASRTRSRRRSAIQAFVAAGVKPPAGAFAFLASAAPAGRQLPLLALVRDDAGVGDRAGAAGARSGGRSRCAEPSPGSRRHSRRDRRPGASRPRGRARRRASSSQYHSTRTSD